MKAFGIVLTIALASAPSLIAQENSAEEAVFAAALNGVLQDLEGAPPLMQHPSRDAIVVARRTIGGAPAGFHTFIDRYFGTVTAEELSHSYGESGPESRTIDQKNAGRFEILPLEKFESGPFDYDWQRLNEAYPNVRFVVRLSWPAIDRLGTNGVVRYELIGRDRPAKVTGPWQHASFAKFEKQPDGSWKHTISTVGSIWN
jgi:hypothetical protein